MRTLFFLLLLCHTASPVTHSMRFFVTVSTEVPNLPALVVITEVDDMHIGYRDSNKKTTLKLGSGYNILKYYPQHIQRRVKHFIENWSVHYRTRIFSFMQQFNQSGGVHTLQTMRGCEWDEATGEVLGFFQFGYDGEDLISLDFKTQTWVTPKRQVVATKLKWDADKADIKFNEEFLTEICPESLKKYLVSGNNILLKTVPPSVSVLQKSPSSPISCFATGFYPNRADMFWRRDGEQTHEDVDHGEILPNPDGTFQMRVDLDLSSVRAPDWSSYDCVFQLSGVKDDIINKLDRAGIRTNAGNNDTEASSHMTPIVVVLVVLFVIIIIIITAVVTIYKKNKAKCPSPPPEQGCELAEKLNPDE